MMRDTDMPWRVVTQKNGCSSFVRGFLEKSEAEECAQVRNRQAEELGIETRYKAVCLGGQTLTKDGEEA